ncbi:MAG: hypothetical protein ACI4DU_05380 [Lachnospiraceae bacterium]
MTCRTCSVITTLFNTVMAFLSLIITGVGFWCLFSVDTFLELFGGSANIDPNSPSAGLELLGSFALLGLGLLSGLIGIAIILIGIIFLIFTLVPSIHGLVLWSKERNMVESRPDLYRKSLKTDAILKIVFQSIMTIVFLAATIFTFHFIFLTSFLMFLVATVVAVMQLAKNDMPQLR